MEPEESSRTLVAAIVAGDAARFAEVVRRHDRRVREIVARGERDPARREELVQQTFYQAFRRLADLEVPDQLEAWLVTIARNAVADAARRRATREQRERPLAGLEPTLIAPDELQQRRAWIWDEVLQLAPIHRDVVELRYRHGLDWDEIAARLGVPRSTVRGRLYEARRALRQRLTNLGDDRWTS